jgi:hypothetical protein
MKLKSLTVVALVLLVPMVVGDAFFVGVGLAALAVGADWPLRVLFINALGPIAFACLLVFIARYTGPTEEEFVDSLEIPFPDMPLPYNEDTYRLRNALQNFLDDHDERYALYPSANNQPNRLAVAEEARRVLKDVLQ